MGRIHSFSPGAVNFTVSTNDDTVLLYDAQCDRRVLRVKDIMQPPEKKLPQYRIATQTLNMLAALWLVISFCLAVWALVKYL